LHGRVAAIFALKQLDGGGAHGVLRKLLSDDAIREFALRALTDRKTELGGVETAPFVAALADPSPRVRAQAVIALGRLGDPSVAARLVPLTSRPDGSPMPTARPVNAQPDPGRVVPHLAMRALIALRAVDACLDAIDGPHREGALRVLRSLHEPTAVEGLVKKLATNRSPDARREILATLVRLYHREADYQGSWWRIRPDATGPYFDPREWEGSGRIASVLRAAVLDGDPPNVMFVRGEYEAYSFATASGWVFTGFVVSEGAATIQIRESPGDLHELKRAELEERRRQDPSAMPDGVAGNLTPDQLADLVAYLQSLNPTK
jgi:putative heme-binding domain-containing protein